MFLLGASKQREDDGGVSFKMLEDTIQVGLELIESPEQVVADVGASRVAPDPFDEIQVRAVGRQPGYRQMGADVVLFEEGQDFLGLVDAGIVGDENDPPFRPFGPSPQVLHQDQEAPRDLPGETDEFRVPMGVLHRSEDEFLPVLAGSGNGELMPFQSPAPREMGMEMTFGLVFVPELEIGMGLEGLFFERDSRFLARRCAVSSRLPLSVCLGRP